MVLIASTGAIGDTYIYCEALLELNREAFARVLNCWNSILS